MITKRKGNGQTECYGCKQKGKFALNWDSFLYTFNDKPYCFDCLMEKLEQLQQENQELNQKYLNAVADYEQEKFNVEELKKQLEEFRLDIINGEPYIKLKTVINQQKEFIEYLEYQVKLQEELNDKHLATGFEEILSKYKEIIGNNE